jgi:hypothetical protein
LILIVQVCMLFHNARLAVHTLILALLFAFGARVSPAQESEPPAAYLAANSLRGIELFALYADGSVAETPTAIAGAFAYGSEAFDDWKMIIEVPDDFLDDTPRIVHIENFSLSPDATHLAYTWWSGKKGRGPAYQTYAEDGLGILNLVDGVQRDYSLQTHSVFPPMWSIDSQTLLFDQHNEDLGIYRIELFDLAANKSITVIEGFENFHVVRLWITPEHFLIWKWPNIYIGDTTCVCTELLVTLNKDLVGATEDIVRGLEFGSAAWSAHDQTLYIEIATPTDLTPGNFSGLYSISLDGQLTQVVDYVAFYGRSSLQALPYIVVDSPYGSLNLLSTTNTVFHRIDRYRNSPVFQPETLEFVLGDGEGGTYVLSPDAKHIAIVGTSTDRDNFSSMIYIVKLGSATIEVATTGVDSFCDVFWLNATTLIARPGSGWLCKSAPLSKLLWLDIESGEQKSISLPDGREFWLIMPQQP